jgi:hypothetical protein
MQQSDQLGSAVGRRNLRNAAGTGIVEGAAGLLLIIVSAIAGTVLLAGGGAAAYYKYKLGCVTNKAAFFLSNSLYPDGADNPGFSAAPAALQANASTLVQQLLSDFGLPPGTVSARTLTGGRSGRQMVVVTVTVSGLPLIHPPAGLMLSALKLPSTINLQDTAAAAIPLKMPPGLLQIQDRFGHSAYVPGFGATPLPPTWPPSSSYSFNLTP